MSMKKEEIDIGSQIWNIYDKQLEEERKNYNLFELIWDEFDRQKEEVRKKYL